MSGPYALTVRATAGTDTVDVAVTVTVTDEAEAPEFGETSYAFELAENTDGSVTRVSLGTVAAKDPDDGDTVSYAIAAGNESGRFAIDASSGVLYYVGAGEDHEGVSGPYALTVRATAGTDTVDVAVTVTVTDETEAPEFGETSYAFELAENTDGSVTRVSLGTVAAKDPDDGDTVSYAIAAGNESGRFAIDASNGVLYYVGSGEDHEGDSGPYELTVRAGDRTHTVDATVTVTVSDVPEGVSEPAGGDLAQDRSTKGEVLVDQGPVTGRIETVSDQDWFAVELEAGRPYVIEQRGMRPGTGHWSTRTSTGCTTPRGVASPTPRRRTVGCEYNSRLEFTAPSDGRYYVSAAGGGVATRGGSGRTSSRYATRGRLCSHRAATPSRSRRTPTGARPGCRSVTVTATDPDGDAVRHSLADGNESGRFAIDARTGALSYIGPGEDYESETKRYELTVSASDGEYASQATVVVTVTDDDEAPAFAETSYAFTLAENVDGSVTRVSLGTVGATDPDGDAVRYELAGDVRLGAVRARLFER